MRIAVDLDEVIGGLLPAFLAFYERTQGISLEASSFHTYDWWEVVGVSRERMFSFFDEFADAGHLLSIEPIDGAVAAIEELSADHSLMVITSRPKKLTEETVRWVNAHFPQMFDDICLTSQFSKEGVWQTKAEVCRESCVDLIVEDHLDFALECAEEGIDVLLFDMPWNRDAKLPKNVVRVSSWQDALSEIKRRAV